MSMRTSGSAWTVVLVTCAIAVVPIRAVDLAPVLTPVVTTAPLFNYEGAPATPDADDPAIWLNHADPERSLVIGTAKDAGLLVYDLSGQLVQAMLPPNAPRITATTGNSRRDFEWPTPCRATPASRKPRSAASTTSTWRTASRSGTSASAPRADVVIVSDRGCDRVRFYRVDVTAAGGPLLDITAPDVPRVFPMRYDQPSPLQPSGALPGWRDNPIDDQNTVYGLTVSQDEETEVFVTQRERGLVRQMTIVAAPNGRLTYQVTRTFLFLTSFDLRGGRGARYDWTPCRETALEEPQSEGLVFDRQNRTLYVAFETIGLYSLALRGAMPPFVTVTGGSLIEPVKSFGRAYRATPDDEEFECGYDPENIDPGDVLAVGSPVNAGRFLEADLEGLSIVSSLPGRTAPARVQSRGLELPFLRPGRASANASRRILRRRGRGHRWRALRPGSDWRSISTRAARHSER